MHPSIWKSIKKFSLAASLAACCSPAFAQPPGGFGGGGFGGGPGGFGGGGFGGPGGGMMMMGGRGGGGGGFDPSSFITRLDANGNGSIDPDEMQGPAKFMLDRMAQSNPNIDLTKPIPLATLTSEFEKMRGGGGGWGGGGWGGGGWGGGGWGGGDNDDANGAPSVELVPGFGKKSRPEPPKGFGSKAETLSVKIEPQDLADAEERIRRNDRNRDGVLDEDELKGLRWNDNPIQYDKNRDKKLSAQELAIRIARKRANDAANPDKAKEGGGGGGRDGRRGGGGGWGGGNWGGNGGAWGGGGGAPVAAATEEKKSDQPAYREKTASYKLENETRKSTGVPGWLVDLDINKDGQVTMNEFSGNWNAATLEDWRRFDTDSDGVITQREGLLAAKNNVLRASISDAKPSSSSSDSSSSSKKGESKFSREGLPEGAEERWITFCEKGLSDADKNKNGAVSFDEWDASKGKFEDIDTDKDGVISLAEYYIHRKKPKK